MFSKACVTFLFSLRCKEFRVDPNTEPTSFISLLSFLWIAGSVAAAPNRWLQSKLQSLPQRRYATSLWKHWWILDSSRSRFCSVSSCQLLSCISICCLTPEKLFLPKKKLVSQDKLSIFFSKWSPLTVSFFLIISLDSCPSLTPPTAAIWAFPEMTGLFKISWKSDTWSKNKETLKCSVPVAFRCCHIYKLLDACEKIHQLFWNFLDRSC